MTVTYGFYDSVSGDRVYNALQMSSIFDGIITDGIYDAIPDAFIVRANNAMNVLVSSGRAWFNHTWTYNDADLLVTVPTAEVVLDRIDTVVIEINRADGNRENRIRLIAGTPGSTPVPPVLTQAGTLFQYPLADIYVDHGVTSIAANKITNRVGTVDCPFVTGVLESLSIDALYSNWQAEMDALQLSEQTQFENWFNNLVNELTTQQATNLQNQIDTILYHDHGWMGLSNTLSSAGTPYYNDSYIAQCTANLTSVLSPGMRLKYTQSQPLTVAWNFNTDSQSQIITITRTDTSMTYTAGKFSNAATFNGTTSKILLANNTAQLKLGENLNGFTIGGYIKVAASSANPQTIFYSGSRNTNYAGIIVELDTSRHISVTVGYNTGTSSGTNYDTIVGKTVLATGTTYHFTVTLRNDLLRIYLNGVIDGEGYATWPAYAATTYHLFGAKTLTGAAYIDYLNGQIDDFFIIYDYALDEKTIYARSQLTSSPGTSNISIVKMGIITSLNWSGSYTYISVWGGTEYDLSDLTITNVSYSSMYAPKDFDPTKDRWAIKYKDGTVRTLSSPSAGTWYNHGSFAISVPAGIWELSYNLMAGSSDTLACNVLVTLSKNSSAEDDPDFTTMQQWSIAVTNGTYTTIFNYCRNKVVRLTENTIYYILYQTTVAANNIKMNQGPTPLILKAECAYL